MATTMQAYRILCRTSPLLPDEGWSDPDQARRRLGVASGGEGVMIRLALALWLDEEFLISDVLRLDHVNRSAVRAALEPLLS